MRTVTLEELLEAGCHFGHQVTRHNPNSRDFVFEARDNIHIIDLAKTKEGLENAGKLVKSIAERQDSTILVLGTKRQAQEIVKEEVKRASLEGINGIYSVTTRWIGGTFTNFAEVLKNYKKLKDITAKLHSDFEKMNYTKKEISLWEKERQKLESFYGGTKDMVKKPDLLFVIDTHLEDLAVREANAMSVPVVGIVDTNANPDPIKYVIPANDDAAGSIKLITAYVIDAWIEGKKKVEKDKETKEPEGTKGTEVKEEKAEKVSKAKIKTAKTK